MTVTNRVKGPFDVKMIPQPPDEAAGGAAIGRMLLDKTFHGALDATSKGQMLAVMTGVKDSAGYVAMEHVVGTLEGKRGTFALQHSGTMNRGKQSLDLHVVPDSGTGDLVGLTGKMAIVITGGKHEYDFEYALGG
jgi:hypothetical protein